MTRLARRVFPGLPHHVTQRGNRREAIFFEDGDHEIYLDLLAEQTRKAGVEVWACCLMPDHVHLFMTPATPQKRGQRRRKGDRGRDAHYWAPPAQNRTSGIPAYGSHLGCLTAKRWFGHG